MTQNKDDPKGTAAQQAAAQQAAAQQQARESEARNQARNLSTEEQARRDADPAHRGTGSLANRDHENAATQDHETATRQDANYNRNFERSHDRRLAGGPQGDPPTTEREAIQRVGRESHDYQTISEEERARRNREVWEENDKAAAQVKAVDYATVCAEITKAGIATTPPIEMADGVAFNVVGVGGQLYPVKLTLDDLVSADMFNSRVDQLRATYGGAEFAFADGR